MGGKGEAVGLGWVGLGSEKDAERNNERRKGSRKGTRKAGIFRFFRRKKEKQGLQPYICIVAIMV